MELDHQPAHIKSEGPVTVTPKPLLSVIIPVYNEIKTIAEVIARVRAVPLSTEIILVNDGSTDGTGEFLEPEGNKPMTVVCNSLINLGKGSAVRIGLERVQGEIVIIQDADLELDPAEFPKLIKPIQEGQTDVVFGSRFLGRGLFGRVPNSAGSTNSPPLKAGIITVCSPATFLASNSIPMEPTCNAALSLVTRACKS